ncbi:MAG: TonB family protein [Acidobacteriota bacterium]
MQTIVVAFVLSLLFFQSSGQGKKTDREFDEMNGPVRFVRVDTEDVRDQSGNPKNNARALERIASYDPSGRMTEEIVGVGSNCAASRHVFSYDAAGNRTETVYWGKDVVPGNKTSPPQPHGSPVERKQVFKLNKSGERSEVDEYDSAGRPLGKTRYKYDDKGRVKEIIEENNSTSYRCEFKYNDSGLPSERVCEYPDFRGRDKTQYAYELAATGSWIKRTAKVSSVAPNGSVHESTRIFYREFQYYSSAEDQAQPQAVAERFDATKLAPCPPMIIRKSGGVFQGSATRRVEPRYPPDAIAARISGSVVVEVTADEEGRVISARAISGPVELRGVAVEAAKGWAFRPTSLSGTPVKVIGTITFNFNL